MLTMLDHVLSRLLTRMIATRSVRLPSRGHAFGLVPASAIVVFVVTAVAAPTFASEWCILRLQRTRSRLTQLAFPLGRRQDHRRVRSCVLPEKWQLFRALFCRSIYSCLRVLVVPGESRAGAVRGLSPVGSRHKEGDVATSIERRSSRSFARGPGIPVGRRNKH